MGLDDAVHLVASLGEGGDEQHVVHAEVVGAVEVAQTVDTARAAVHAALVFVAAIVEEGDGAVLREDGLEVLQETHAALGKAGTGEDVSNGTLH